MACLAEAPELANSLGLRLIEKNTFLHFVDIVEFNPGNLRASRRGSAPAAVAEFHTKHELSLPEDVDTVMIRGIPSSCTRDEILDTINEVGFNDLHDFFYAPMRRNKTLGYAFLGFPDAQLARNFAKAITGYRFRGRNSSKRVSVTPAAIQGYGRNLDHFSGTFVMNSFAKPLFA
jgi:hypothetical protein